jgi:phytoene desaturase
VGKKVVIIGSGFAGLSAAAFMAKAGWDVQVLEKQSTAGGRARMWRVDGFSFDMGPSWYWMPEVFERFFSQFGKKVSDYYTLRRLDPSYRIYWDDDVTDIPADYASLKALFEKFEKGSAEKLDQFLAEAEYKYKVGINKLVFKPGQSITEFADWDLVKGLFRLDVFSSIQTHVHKYFKNPRLRQILEFPVLFLGALPENTPALYSLMNYADIKLGTWFPEGGMYKIVEGMYNVAMEQGVKFSFNSNVSRIELEQGVAKKVVTEDGNVFEADVVIGGADYHFIETELLPETHRSYSAAYWDKRVMAPGCLLFYVGVKRKLKNLQHHSLFFDVPFEKHAKEIYESPSWPAAPLFYLCASSVTDPTQAPEGCENLFFLIPLAAGLEGDSEEIRERYFEMMLERLKAKTGEDIKEDIIVKRSFSIADFKSVYNAFKGNAYGMANTLMQTAVLKPSCRSGKVRNLFFTGQLTVPGPGVPPSLISGEVVAGEVVKHFGK